MNTGETTTARGRGPWQILATLLVVLVVLMGLIGTVVTLVAHPDPDSFLAYSDPNDMQSLPTWFSTVVLGLAALAAALVGRTTGVDRRWWSAACGALLLFSLCVFSAVHTRLDGLARQALGSNLLTRDWLPSAIAAWLVLSVPFVVLALRGRTTSRAGLLGALALFGASGLADELSARVSGSTADPATAATVPASGVIATNLAGTVHMLAGVWLLLVLLRDIPARRDGSCLRLTVRDRLPDAPPWVADEPTVPDRRPLWRWLVVVTLVFGLLSLLVILPFPDPSQKLVGWAHFLDLDHESNLASWWSIGLLAGAGMTQALAGWMALLAGDRRTARGWFVTAVLMTGLSLDDATSVHERLGDMIKPHGQVQSGDFPYFWLIPGGIAGLVVAGAFGVHALRLVGRTRWLLVGGLGFFLFCSMGLEGIEGWLIKQGVGRTVQVLGYHVEEIGENLGALLLVAAGTSAVALLRRRRDVSVGLATAGPQLDHAVGDATEAIPHGLGPARSSPPTGTPGPLSPADLVPGRHRVREDEMVTAPIPHR